MFNRAMEQILNLIIPARRRRAQLIHRLWGYTDPKGGTRGN